MKRPITRRRLWAGASALALSRSAEPARAAPASLPQQPSLLVAGPMGGTVGRWAEVIAPTLGRSMLGAPALSWTTMGGADGITGVNQYQARINPDGATALLLPGTALLAWLVGDTRVRFDAGAWAPLWGGSTTAIVASRQPLVAGQRVRLAVGTIVGPELEALLALHMMGIEAVPVLPSGPDKLRQPDVDAVYLRGRIPRERLAEYGWRPAVALGAPGSAAAAMAPPAAELFAPSLRADAALLSAFHAVAAAACLDVALVMPAVAPAAVLAWWRRGCEQLDDEAAVREAAAAMAVRQDDAGAIAAQLGSIALDTGPMLALRTLLAERYHWQPG